MKSSYFVQCANGYLRALCKVLSVSETSKYIYMGFNISGLAINKNYQEEFDKLQKQLGWQLVRQGEVDFETASENWKEDGICDVYFCEKGTILFMSMEKCAESFPLDNDNTLSFALSESVTAFNLNYCEQGLEKRSIMEVNDERMQDERERLAIEDQSEDTSEIIWNQIAVVIGKRFWDIEPDEKAYRYLFTTVNTLPNATTSIENQEIVQVMDARVQDSESKNWWQFWK